MEEDEGESAEELSHSENPLIAPPFQSHRHGRDTKGDHSLGLGGRRCPVGGEVEGDDGGEEGDTEDEPEIDQLQVGRLRERRGGV